ncbi:hypothetical protein [Micromonospora yangpuensis]|uniref:Phage XkdN-like tail assembly chaperone protein, TAC n=1 Tax=Micromonospora yangpuensis TaxID=683228 RepID=A0A1C6VEX8_9ACTN|nr:hypothetical protein [Micromonospora yangpuensis]GGM14335.1 hypothetical protein GCM10012279_35540 [Micromonospora yangpuensis]SCL64594.1 hypothetical protein GA0070617_5510 [Micromonospora yangpuensis]
MTTLLNRDQILAVDDSTWEDVEVPEWGGTVRVKGMSGTERDKFEAGSLKGKGKNRDVNLANLRARLVAASVVDEHGQPVFRPYDVEALGRKSAAALGRVYDVAQRLAGLTDEDVDELTEDFPDDPSEPSTSA